MTSKTYSMHLIHLPKKGTPSRCVSHSQLRPLHLALEAKAGTGGEILFPKCHFWDIAGSSAGVSHPLLPILQMKRGSPGPVIGKVVLRLMGPRLSDPQFTVFSFP